LNKRLRIFLSSPGDVRSAREIAALTIERLAQDYGRFFVVEPYLWEYEAMLASGHFQDSIEPPSAFDIVVLILWSRLGTPLPERTALREYRGIDGRTPVTGTEWEYEEALKATQEVGTPDLLVYRSREDARVKSWDIESRQRDIDQLAALDRFWARHFANQGTFLGAYTEFASNTEFAAAFENHLRGLIAKRITSLAQGGMDAGANVWMQAPFRGLESYDFEHAPIFFGQDEALTKAMVQLAASAERGVAFLLVMGASGSGKSSLVKAGILPKLFVLRRIPGAAFVRRVVFRPSDAQDGEDLFDALARRLVTQVSPQEGVSELLGSGQTLSSLAAHLRNASEAPAYPVATALGRIADEARQNGVMLRHETARLVLVVDQLEELFTIETFAPEQRRRFVSLLANLARSGHVWVVATMRSDFWHRASEVPELVQQAEGGGRLDLVPPSIAQIGQMIRRPAEAAGISFEIPEKTEGDDGCKAGVPLNEAILEEIGRDPGTLPLLSYLLDQLYRSDVLEGSGSTLTYKTYKRLGGLKGAIAARAEAILTSQAPEVRLALRRLLFSLVQISVIESGTQQITARRAPLSGFPKGSPARRLLEAFLDPSARLIIAEAGAQEEPTTRVAHEALLTEWGLARELLCEIAGELKTRRMVEERFTRWNEVSGAARGARKLLATLPLSSGAGLLVASDLEDAKRLLRNHRENLPDALVDYVDRSHATARRKRRLAIGAFITLVVVLSVLTLSAIVEAISARHYSQLMENALRTDHGLVIRAEASGDAFMTGKMTDSRDVAIAIYRIRLELSEQLAKFDPNNLDWKHDIAGGNARIGFVLEQQSHVRDALPYFQASLAISQQLVAAEPADPAWQRDLNAAKKLLIDAGKQLAAEREKPTASRP
jgi:hypothetical protein